MTDRGETLQTFVLLSMAKYKGLEQQLKKNQETHPPDLDDLAKESNSPSPPPTPSAVQNSEVQKTNSETESIVGKNLTKSYRQNKIRKLLGCLKNTENGDKILKLANLEQLINTSLNQSTKPQENEEMFFKFLFENGLASYVRNRHKIRKWYKTDWFII